MLKEDLADAISKNESYRTIVYQFFLSQFVTLSPAFFYSTLSLFLFNGAVPILRFLSLRLSVRLDCDNYTKQRDDHYYSLNPHLGSGITFLSSLPVHIQKNKRQKYLTSLQLLLTLVVCQGRSISGNRQ